MVDYLRKLQQSPAPLAHNAPMTGLFAVARAWAVV